jgi:Putative peptidoglycan binding domain
MKITTVSKVASLVISSLMMQTAIAGHAVGIGVGPHSAAGESGDGIFDMLFGSGGFHQRDSISSADRHSTANSRQQIASYAQQLGGRAGEHIVSRQGASMHRYMNDGVYKGNRSSDPTVTVVQHHLTKLGYYHRSIDGLYGRATRHAVARYQADHRVTVTGTLTRRVLHLLRIPPTGRAEMGSEVGTNRAREISSRIE